MSRIFTALAALKVDPESDIGYSGMIRSPEHALTSILNVTYMWAGVICVLILIVAGFLFVTSRGDPAQMKRSKDAIRGAVVGLVVVLVAFTITQFILGRLS
jgi:cytochrome bd-type quinol oxidase subunit 2